MFSVLFIISCLCIKGQKYNLVICMMGSSRAVEKKRLFNLINQSKWRIIQTALLCNQSLLPLYFIEKSPGKNHGPSASLFLLSACCLAEHSTWNKICSHLYDPCGLSIHSKAPKPRKYLAQAQTVGNSVTCLEQNHGSDVFKTNKRAN